VSARSVALLGACGGCGASVVAAGIALAWSRTSERVWLADLDIERGDLAGGWDLPTDRTIDDLARVAGELSPAHLDRAAARAACGVRLLPAPGRIGASGAWGPSGASALCAALAGAGDVVMDAGAPVMASAAVAAAGSTLLVCPGTLSSVRRAARIVEALHRAGVGERLGVVVRRARPAEVSARAMRRALQVNVIAELPHSEAEARSIAAGSWPTRRRRPLADALARVAEVLP
jgi:Flp pilus assembly CpaE family ATPase